MEETGWNNIKETIRWQKNKISIFLCSIKMSGKTFDVEVDVDVEIQFRQCLTFKVQCLN